MNISVSITEEQLFKVLGDFLTAILPASCAVVRGQANRVPEPQGTDFAVMWPGLRERLSTNVDDYSDIAFTGSIAGTTLTVTQMLAGTVSVDLFLGANGITANTKITAEGTGTGGVGTYTVNNTQTLASTTIQAGTKDVLAATKVTVQIDVHGPHSADNAQIITTLFRDAYGVALFAVAGFDVQPLYCDDPRQTPFINGEQQQEERWSIQAVMQANPIVEVAQQFAQVVDVNVVDAEQAYPN